MTRDRSVAGSSGATGPGPVEASSLQETYVSIVKQVNPSVVVIETSQGLGSQLRAASRVRPAAAA
jgi:hypothetical protein